MIGKIVVGFSNDQRLKNCGEGVKDFQFKSTIIPVFKTEMK